jgi:WD40 repeat protein
VLALRADFYGRCAEHPQLSRLLAANHVLVGPMQRDELHRAVQRPAHRAGLRVEPELVDVLVHDVEGRPAALPLLSTVLLGLWQRRDGRLLRRSAYEAIGGVQGAVARLAEDAFAALDAGQQAVARRVLMRLAGVSEGAGAERRRVPLAELEGQPDGEVGRVVALLTDRRLLTVTDGTVEYAHEALLREWPRLAAWIDEDRDCLRIQRNLSVAAREWRELDRDDGALYRGTRLSEAIEWDAAHDPPLSALEREFLDASAARRVGEETARRRRTQLAFAGLITALVGITVGAIVALSQGREAERQREIAGSRELAIRATSLLDADPGLSLGLALRALRRRDTEQARNAVRQATHAARGTGAWPARDGWLYAAAPSGDGRSVATAAQNGAVRIWDLASGRVTSTIRGHRGDAYSVSLSPDGRSVASAGADGTVLVSDTRGGHRRRLAIVKPPAFVSSVEFAPHAESLLLAVSDATVRIVPLSGGGRPLILRGHEGPVYSADFDRDGRRVVSASADHSARVWDVARAATTAVLPHAVEVQNAAFSPDGRRVATAAVDGTARIWDARGGGRPVRIRADGQSVYSVRFSADGRRLLSAGEDGVLRLWDVRSGRALGELKGHRGRALQASFVPGGGSVVSAGEDGVLRRWAPPDDAVILAPGVSGARVSPDGRSVVSGGLDGGVRVLDLRSGTARDLAGHGDASVARFSSDGRRVVSASIDGSVRISDPARGGSTEVPAGSWQKFAIAYDARRDRIALGGPRPHNVIQSSDGTRRIVLRGHSARVYDLAFSRDGRLLASASEDGTARIWNAHTGALLRTLRGHRERVTSVAFSTDGRRVVTAGADGTVRVWHLDGGAPVIMRGHDGVVTSATFSADGTRVVSAGQDGTVRVWDAAGGETLVIPYRHARSASGADFSPDGRHVVSAGDEGAVRVSPCDVCGSFAAVLRLARTRADRDVSDAEQHLLGAG